MNTITSILTLFAATMAMAKIEAAEPGIGKFETANSPSLSATDRLQADISRIERKIASLQRAAEQGPLEAWPEQIHFPRTMVLPLFPGGCPDELAADTFPNTPPAPTGARWSTAPFTYRRAWQQQSSSSWSQVGSRFCYEQPVRGIIVRLEGSVTDKSLDIDRIEIDAGESPATQFQKAADVPADYQDELDLVRKAALKHVAQ